MRCPDFLSGRTEAWLAGIYFLLAVRIVWRLTTLAGRQAQHRGRDQAAKKSVVLLYRRGRLCTKVDTKPGLAKEASGS